MRLAALAIAAALEYETGMGTEAGISGSRRSGSGWVSLTGAWTHGMTSQGWCVGPRAWWGAPPLWLEALRGGGLSLLRSAERSRRALFLRPVRLGRAVAVGYASIPSAWHRELSWLRDTGVREVVVPVAQSSSEMLRDKALAAIQNLRAEGYHIAAVLHPNPAIDASPEGWRLFCQWSLDQVGWQVERVQLIERLETRVRDEASALRLARFFDEMPQWRRDFPKLELFAPGLARFDSRLLVRALRRQLPDGYAWDGLTAWPGPERESAGMGSDQDTLRKMLLAGAVAALPEACAGQVQVCFPSAEEARDAGRAERMLGVIMRRSVLALATGIVSRVVIGVNPEQPVEARGMLAAALRELTRHLEGARFVQRVAVGDPRRSYVFEFARQDGAFLLVGWCDGEPRQVEVALNVGAAWDWMGRTAPLLPYPRLRLTRDLAYFVGRKSAKGTGVRW